jgi:hypothetical protein
MGFFTDSKSPMCGSARATSEPTRLVERVNGVRGAAALDPGSSPASRPSPFLPRNAMHTRRRRAHEKGPYGIRTRAAAVRGRCPRPLDEWAERNPVYRGVGTVVLAGTQQRAALQRAFTRGLPSRRAQLAPVQWRPVAGSSNGRTPDSGSGSQGSSPCPAASKRAREKAPKGPHVSAVSVFVFRFVHGPPESPLVPSPTESVR